MITFHYRSVQTPAGVINRPYALVSLFHGERRCRRIMLIDSGADVSLITRQTGIKLGFTVSPTDEVRHLGGAGGGRIPVIYRQVEMQIGAHLFHAEVGWLQNEQPLLVLGRRGVFNNFSIELREFEGIVIFRHVSELRQWL